MAEFVCLEQKADLMRSIAYDFCSAFVRGSPPLEILDKYFTANAIIIEHGPAWAKTRLPFLATPFQGRRSPQNSDKPTGDTCDDYYDLLTSTLRFFPLPNTLPTKEELMIDPERGTVTVKMHAFFASIETGVGWEEDFLYVLSQFDERGKIGSQELWADPLSAWQAVGD